MELTDEMLIEAMNKLLDTKFKPDIPTTYPKEYDDKKADAIERFNKRHSKGGININLHDLIREGFESYWYEELKTIVETMPDELKQLYEIASQKQEHHFCSDYEAFLTDKDISKFIKKLDEHDYCITKKQYISFFDSKEMTKLRLEIRINKVIAEVIK